MSDKDVERNVRWQAFLLLGLAAGLASFGSFLKPDMEDPIQLPGNFFVEAPSDLVGEDGKPNPLRTIVIQEGHGKSVDSYFTPSSKEFGLREATDDTVQLTVGFTLDHATTDDTEVVLRLDLPDGVELDGYWIPGLPRSQCRINRAVDMTVPGRSGDFLEITIALPRTTTATRPIDPSMGWEYTAGGMAVVRLRGLSPGLVFGADGKRAKVRYPLVIPYRIVESRELKPPSFGAEFQAGVVVAFDGVSAMRWTQNPTSAIKINHPDGNSPNDDRNRQPNNNSIPLSDSGFRQYVGPIGAELAAWFYTMQDASMFAPPPEVSGINELAKAVDIDGNFYAGIAFGTAGATLVGALQKFLSWIIMARGALIEDCCRHVIRSLYRLTFRRILWGKTARGLGPPRSWKTIKGWNSPP